MSDNETIKTMLENISLTLNEPIWKRGDFWVSMVFNILGMILSGFGFWAAIKAKDEAKSAKLAAQEAGSAVKVQTVVVELTEVTQKLNRLEPTISYQSARDLLNDASQKIRRLTSPYAKDDNLKDPIESLLETLASAQSALSSVRPSSTGIPTTTPSNGNTVTTMSVYYAIEGEFMNISGLIGDLIGLFESMSIQNMEPKNV